MPLLIMSCTSLQTTEQGIGNQQFSPEKDDGMGLHYFLPKALLTIEGAPDDKSPGDFKVIVSRKMVADDRKEFHLRWKNNPFYHDKISTPIEVNEQCLLTSVQFDAEDKTAAILEDLTKTTINVFKILGGGGPQLGDAPGPMESFSITFDPLDIAETRSAQSALKALIGGDINICPPANRIQSCIGDGMSGHDGKFVAVDHASAQREAQDRGGVLYHPPMAIELRFDFRPKANIIHRETVLVPNPDRIASFHFGRSAFVKRSTSLTLSNGMPTKFSLDRPSPIQGFTGMLSSVTTIVGQAIPTLVNVKVNKEISEINAEKSLIAAKTALANAEKAKLDADSALSKVILNSSAGGPQYGTPDVKSNMQPGPGYTPPGGGNPKSGDASAQSGKNESKEDTKMLQFQGTVELPN
ncbi:hypothetical protein EI77_04584 [Prosthecobacter fusiformis]|uniref:Uncharacterized protein n=1 Tax=Prosthecobacter fusiformis TaxID=48464 RepID=A0A4R7RKA4_9BACT|nr:hypothetical protein [Prosthecobacter fusiformis]TDU63063.1 hypothetical protein EI77_04584 [Prosthecobacter fusiformis]